jgi:hypothetical protein
MQKTYSRALTAIHFTVYESHIDNGYIYVSHSKTDTNTVSWVMSPTFVRTFSIVTNIQHKHYVSETTEAHSIAKHGYIHTGLSTRKKWLNSHSES